MAKAVVVTGNCVTTLLRIPATARWLWPPERYASLLLGVVWLLLASPYPPSLRSTGMVLILVVLVLNVVIGVGTGWLAFARTSTLDQRQVAVRNRAYRLAFMLVGAGTLLMIALAIAGGFAPQTGVNQSLSQLPKGLSTRRLVALLEVVLIAPTGLIAWSAAEPDLVTRTKGTPRGWSPALSIPLVAVVWFIAVAAMPARTVTVQDVSDGLLVWGSTWSLAAKKEIGYGLGGAVRMQAEVCWNGERASFFGGAPSRTDCGPIEGDADFVVVSETCILTGDRDGAILMIARGRVSPLPGGLGTRDVEIQIEVGASGGVIALG